MKINSLKTIKTVLFGGALGLSALAVVGCSGGESDAPSNTASSTYMGKGDTSADKIGAARAAGHNRLRNPATSTPATPDTAASTGTSAPTTGQ